METFETQVATEYPLDPWPRPRGTGSLFSPRGSETSSATFPILSRDLQGNGSGFRKERWLERMDQESTLRS